MYLLGLDHNRIKYYDYWLSISIGLNIIATPYKIIYILEIYYNIRFYIYREPIDKFYILLKSFA